MALSLASLYTPLADFFLDKFQTDADSPIQFRFDKFGSVLSDNDFIDPSHPDLGYLPALATERFSELVNHIPVDTADGANIYLSADLIDSTYYFRLLLPAAPYLSNGMDQAAEQARIASAGALKTACIRQWESVTQESITGWMLEYKPSTATPTDWYDKSSNDIWTSHSFQASSDSDTAGQIAPDPYWYQLWKLRPNDLLMLKAIDGIPDPRPIPPEEYTRRLLEKEQNWREVQPHYMQSWTAPEHPAFAVPGEAYSLLPDAYLLTGEGDGSGAATSAEDSDPPELATTGEQYSWTARNSALLAYKEYVREFDTLAMSERLRANQYLSYFTPTQVVTTSQISIKFDYCLVHIGRPWLQNAFLNDHSWYVPGVPKGQVTSSSVGTNFTLLPIGFVVIRNLVIEADWTSEDLANASLATDFGPFKVTKESGANRLAHPGIQIIGWLLQKLPSLPPN